MVPVDITIAVHALPLLTVIDGEMKEGQVPNQKLSVQAQIHYQHKAYYDVPVKRVAHRTSYVDRLRYNFMFVFKLLLFLDD